MKHTGIVSGLTPQYCLMLMIAADRQQQTVVTENKYIYNNNENEQ